MVLSTLPENCCRLPNSIFYISYPRWGVKLVAYFIAIMSLWGSHCSMISTHCLFRRFEPFIISLLTCWCYMSSSMTFLSRYVTFKLVFNDIWVPSHEPLCCLFSVIDLWNVCHVLGLPVVSCSSWWIHDILDGCCITDYNVTTSWTHFMMHHIASIVSLSLVVPRYFGSTAGGFAVGWLSLYMFLCAFMLDMNCYTYPSSIFVVLLFSPSVF